MIVLTPPDLDKMQTKWKTRVSEDLVKLVDDYKLHVPESSCVTCPPDFSQFGPQGMFANLRQTLIAERLFGKMSLTTQAKRADAVTKANVHNLVFNLEQLASACESKDLSTNVTGLANMAYMMLYGPQLYTRHWVLCYQVVVKKNLGDIVRRSRKESEKLQAATSAQVPHAKPKAKLRATKAKGR